MRDLRPLLLLVLFSVACGRLGFNAQKGTSADYASMGLCENDLKQVFAVTWFPLLTTNCNSCHGDKHGSADLDTSFWWARHYTADLIEYQATHPHGGNGVNLTSEVATIKNDWNTGQTNYLSCLAGSGSGPGPVAGARLKLLPKMISGVQQTLTSPNNWKTVTWDLDTEVETSLGQYPAILKIEARYALQSGSVIGFEFRNPMMRLKTAGSENIEVSGLNLFLDGQFQSNVTTYTGLHSIISSTTDVGLAPGAAYALAFFPSAVSTTSVALEFVSIKKTSTSGGGGGGGGGTGTAVTFTELTSTDPTLGVFRNRCFGCHSGSVTRGGLDISNYNQAMNMATRILTRMNSTTSPMPQSGLLLQAERDVVSRWVNAGTPQ